MTYPRRYDDPLESYNADRDEFDFGADMRRTMEQMMRQGTVMPLPGMRQPRGTSTPSLPQGMGVTALALGSTMAYWAMPILARKRRGRRRRRARS